jgi:membrane-bound lytic murein transglycosylase B
MTRTVPLKSDMAESDTAESHTARPFMLHAVLGLLVVLLAPSAHAIDSTRSEVRAFIEEMVHDHGSDRLELVALLQAAQSNQTILSTIGRPAERVVPWYEYRAQFLNAKRIAQGHEFWIANAERLQPLQDSGLAAAIAGIVGVETSYGRAAGRFRIIDALATLAFDYRPRGEFFRDELRNFLLLSREQSVDPANAMGSYAGAMGIPQFIPSSYRQFAVDGDGDGSCDLWSNWHDVIYSVANYLKVHGWRDGEPVITEAKLSNTDLTHFDVSTLALNETVQSLRDKGVRFETQLPPDAPAMLAVLRGRSGPEYRVAFNNFYVITRYNRSTMYALAVYELGQAVRKSHLTK